MKPGHTVSVRIFTFFSVLFLLAVVSPAAAYTVAPVIERGGSIFIGEQGLNVTHALNQARGSADIDAVPELTAIGWWAGYIESSSPSRVIDLGNASRYASLTVSPADFVGYTGNWYLLDASGTRPYSPGSLVFIVHDPYLSLRMWDFNHTLDVSGRLVARGDLLGFTADTNQYSALSNRFRSPVTASTDDGYIDIVVRNESAGTLTELADSTNTPRTLLRLNVTSTPWTWGDPANPAAPAPWATGVSGEGGQPAYPVGTYTYWAESHLNGLKENYRQGGADYTGKTVSRPDTVSLVNGGLQLQINRDPVRRGQRFSVSISGDRNTPYLLWVENTSTMTGMPGDQPPTILPSAQVYQDPYDGPYAIGAYLIHDGGQKTILDDVPFSTADVARNEYYAKAVTSPTTTMATIEFRTSPQTKPGLYTIRVENESNFDEVTVEVLPDIVPGPPDPVTENRVIYRPLINPDSPAPANDDLKRISRGAYLFIGEDGLDISGVFASANAVADPAPGIPETEAGWWPTAYPTGETAPAKIIDLAGRQTRFAVPPADFVGYTGNWYLINATTGRARVDGSGNPVYLFSIRDPSLDLRIWNARTNADVTSRSVRQGEPLTFRVDTNMYPAFDAGSRPDITDGTPGAITIVFKNENNARYTYLYTSNTTARSLANQRVDAQPWFWGGAGTPASAYTWETDLLDRDRYFFYPAGTYVAWAESTLNGMKGNYKQGGAEYTGKTISQIYTISLIPDTPAAHIHTLNPGDSIQLAIDSAGSGDTIILNPGIYRQHDIILKTDLILQANSSENGNATNTIIDAEQAGRIIDNSGGHSLVIDNLSLRNGSLANAGGGAISAEGGTLTIASSAFSDVFAAHDGGAIQSNGGSVVIASSTFRNCSAAAGGAFSGTSSVTVSASSFSDCTATLYPGGALYPYTSAATITSSSFSNCSAPRDTGGAIASFQGPVSISSSTFSHCSASYGGALHTWDSPMTITASSFSHCSAIDFGGALVAEASIPGKKSTVIIRRSSFSNCTAHYGSAIWNFDSRITIHFSHFSGNDGVAVQNDGGFLVNATNNWWGTNHDPSEFTSGSVTVSPWLVLNISATPAVLSRTGSSVVRAHLTRNSAGTDTSGGRIFVPDGIPAGFTAPAGDSVVPAMNRTMKGVAKTRFTPSGTGKRVVRATVDGQTVSTGITVLGSPAVTGITPASGIRGGLTEISNLSGTGFAAGAAVSLNRTGWPLINATNVTVVSAKKITCSFAIPAWAPLGYRNVDVKNANGNLGTKVNAFLVKAPAAPTVNALDPATGTRGGLVTITNLSGTGFVAVPTPKVQLVRNGTVLAAENVTVVNGRKISCTVAIPAGAATGAWHARVTNGDQQSGVRNGAFTVTG